MKDYCKIEENKDGEKCYLNENDECHRLNGPSVEYKNCEKIYHINNISYMYFIKDSNKLWICQGILELISEYGEYIKQNIKDLIEEYNPKIGLSSDFYTQKSKLNKNYLKKFPNWLKDFLIL